NFICYGRIDHQVKIRGFRIELGEVESALSQHQGVHQCAVSLQQGESGEKRLVAYVVSSGGRQPATTNLRSHLKPRLPEYMIPSAFVELSQLPLTTNGKLDRKALQALYAAGQEAEAESPRTPVEELIAGIWAEVLRLESVGLHQNFFELGGHSLLATQVL